jgi:rubrerythrin
MDTPPRGETANERLIGTIEQHIRSEQDTIDLYRRLQSELPDPVLATIMRLIVEDEQHHHGALRQMATVLRLGTPTAPAIVPRPDLGDPARSVLHPTISQLEVAAQDERKGADEFRQLARNEENGRDPLIALLLELMAMDSEKHERMLRFVLDEIRTGIRQPGGPTVTADRND